MVARARSLNPDFAFWDENFSVTAKSREEGYNVVFGFCWVDQHHPDRMKNLLRTLGGSGFPIPFFATPESHNTPRAASRRGGIRYSRLAMVLNSFLPAVPFLHSGYEIAERFPINTGLDFTNDELQRYPSEKLPLFSEYAYDWLNREEFTEWIRRLLALRRHYHHLIVDARPTTFRLLEDGPSSLIAFARVAPKDRKRVAVLANADFEVSWEGALPLETSRGHLTDLLSGKSLKIHEGALKIHLLPGECAVFEY
jgi:hypothetical protein